ncbi:MAG: DUF7601 domain-containing protein, partial [Eubacteriaceae bacterium]
MKKFSKLMTTLLVVAMTLMMFGTTTFAAAPSGATWTPTVSKGGSNVTEGQVASTDTYTFELDYNSGYAWGAVPAPTTEPISDAMNITATGKIDGTNKATGSGSMITFTQPGMYHFTFHETATSNKHVDMDTAVYDVDVYVAYAVDSNNVPTSDLLVKSVNQYKHGNQGNDEANKVSADGTLVATNTARTDLKTLTVSKTVTGQTTLATGTDFTFTVKIDGVSDQNSYGITYNDGAGSRPTSIKAGTATTITLQGGQNFKISGLPETATYSVTEIQNDKYTTTVATDTAAAVSGYTATGTMNTSHTVDYTNDSNESQAFLT